MAGLPRLSRCKNFKLTHYPMFDDVCLILKGLQGELSCIVSTDTCYDPTAPIRKQIEALEHRIECARALIAVSTKLSTDTQVAQLSETAVKTPSQRKRSL